MARPNRPQHPYAFIPVPPLRIGEVELPKADPLVVGRAMGLFPPAELFVDEVFRRYRRLETNHLRFWLMDKLRAHMPHQDPQQSGRGVCGICSCNILGHPLASHAQEECQIPTAWRPQLLATNTRAYCAKCRGKSDRHTNCLGAEEACRNCRDHLDLPGQWHQPPSGLCGVTNEEMEPFFQEIRRLHYQWIVETSEEEPLQIKCPNDVPLSRMPAGYERFVGARAFVDVEGRMRVPIYSEGSNYGGLIPQPEPQARLEVSRSIDIVARDHYQWDYNVPANTPPILRGHIQRYRRAQHRVEAERRATQPERDLRFSRGSSSAQSTQEPLVVEPGRRARNGPIELSPKQALDNAFKKLMLINTRKEQLIALGPAAETIHKDDLETLVYENNKRKVGRLANLDPDVISTLKTYVREAATQSESTPAQRRSPQQWHLLNYNVLRQYVKAAPFKNDFFKVIKDLRFALLNISGDSHDMETEGFWLDQKTGRDLSSTYAEFLLKASVILILSQHQVKTTSTNNVAALSAYPRIPGKDPITVALPSPQCFMEEPQHHLAHYFYDGWLLKLAKDLI